MKKSWLEKFDAVKEAQVKRVYNSFADVPAGSRMLIPTPKIIDDYIKSIPKGVVVSVQTMRQDLALANGADFTCPLTAGIFLRIVAELAYEKHLKTKKLKGITPFWRVVDPHSNLANKLTCGKDFIIKNREGEVEQ